MGCKCKGQPKFSEDVMTGNTELADVDLTKEKDSLVRFEHMFPIYKLHISAWMNKL